MRMDRIKRNCKVLKSLLQYSNKFAGFKNTQNTLISDSCLKNVMSVFNGFCFCWQDTFEAQKVVPPGFEPEFNCDNDPAAKRQVKQNSTLTQICESLNRRWGTCGWMSLYAGLTHSWHWVETWIVAQKEHILSCLPHSNWHSYSVTLLEFRQSDSTGNTEEGSLSLVDNGSPWECRSGRNLGV